MRRCAAIWAAATLLQALTTAALTATQRSLQILLLLTALATWLTAAAAVCYATVSCGGYLEESQTRGMRKVIWRVGLCTSAARLMQVVGAGGTPAGLQFSLLYAVIPLTVTFLLTTTPFLTHNFSLRGTALSAVIFVLCTLHAGLLYIHGPPNEGVQALFWNTVFLLSGVPLALSAILQQQALSIRRVNPLRFIWSVLSVDLLLETSLLLVICLLRDWSSAGLVPLKAMLTDFRRNFSDEPGTWQPFILLLLACPVAQVSQLCAVRNCGFKTCTAVVCWIPAVCGVLLSLGYWPPLRQVLIGLVGEPFVVPITTDRVHLSLISLLFNVVLAALAWIFRITELRSAFVLPRYENPSEDAMQLYLPYLDVANERTTDNDRLTSAASELTHEETRRWKRRFSRMQNAGHQNKSLYVPESLPGMQLIRPMPVNERPALLSTLSGCVLCEYTDWKRLHDFITLPTPQAEALLQRTMQDTAETLEIRRRLGLRLPRLQEKVRRSDCVTQYTKRHIALIYAAEATAKKLAAADAAMHDTFTDEAQV